MKHFFLLAFMMVIFSAGGCSSNPKFSFKTDTRRVTILTEPEGAAVFQVNPWCQPPTSLELSPVNDRSVMIVSRITSMKNMPYYETQKIMEQVNNVVVQIKKDGYETYYGTLRTDPKETIVHTIKMQPEKSENK